MEKTAAVTWETKETPKELIDIKEIIDNEDILGGMRIPYDVAKHLVEGDIFSAELLEPTSTNSGAIRGILKALNFFFEVDSKVWWRKNEIQIYVSKLDTKE